MNAIANLTMDIGIPVCSPRNPVSDNNGGSAHCGVSNLDLGLVAGLTSLPSTACKANTAALHHLGFYQI